MGDTIRAGESRMPLRDHFRPPVARFHSPEAMWSMWPGVMVQQLVRHLPGEYFAAPYIPSDRVFTVGTAPPPQVFPEPTVSVDVDLPNADDVGIRIADSLDHRLVAAVEIVGPATKSHPLGRKMLAARCSNSLRRGVCVSIVDLVTIESFSLYAELLSLIDVTDPSLDSPSPIYAVTCRKFTAKGRTRLQAWANVLTVGQKLPTLPIWLTEERAIPLDLETSYEEACRVLRIP